MLQAGARLLRRGRVGDASWPPLRCGVHRATGYGATGCGAAGCGAARHRGAHKNSATAHTWGRSEDPPELAGVKTMMSEDADLWARRPLSALLVRYALHGVEGLMPLRAAMLRAAAVRGGDAALADVARASAGAADYCDLNSEFTTAGVGSANRVHPTPASMSGSGVSGGSPK